MVVKHAKWRMGMDGVLVKKRCIDGNRRFHFRVVAIYGKLNSPLWFLILLVFNVTTDM